MARALSLSLSQSFVLFLSRPLFLPRPFRNLTPDLCSGAIIGAGHWVGDVIRVRIRSFNVVAPTDPTKNWEGIYTVTLQAVDPFWDVAYGVPFSTYADLVLVNDTLPGQRDFYVPPNVPVPTTMRGHIGPGKPQPGSRRAKTTTRKTRGLMAPPAGADYVTLPTVAEWYLNQVYAETPAFRAEAEKSARSRRFVSQQGKAQLFRHPGPAKHAEAVHHQPKLPAAPKHQPKKVIHAAPKHKQSHLKGRRQ
jgi:hypothetical protein